MLQNRETDQKKNKLHYLLRGSNKAWNESRYVFTILHVNMLSTIDLFSVLLTSFFKQGNTACRFDGIIANNREEKKSLPAVCANLFPYTAISRKFVKNKVHSTIPKGNMGYDQYTVSNDCSCRTYFWLLSFSTRKHISVASRTILLNFFEKQCT